jgi:hypothetical protein
MRGSSNIKALLNRIFGCPLLILIPLTRVQMSQLGHTCVDRVWIEILLLHCGNEVNVAVTQFVDWVRNLAES